MSNNDVLVKWTGSKRIQAPKIVEHFPDEIDTYYEPFLGGASVFYCLANSGKKVKKYVLSDINASLIGIYKLVASDPDSLMADYTTRWTELKKQGQDYYYATRTEFNKDKDPKKFFFLLRTCRNGLVRHNKKGEFNSGFHQKRDGMVPATLQKTVNSWHKAFTENNVEIKVASYDHVVTTEGDLLYIDPPYVTPENSWAYFGMIDLERMYEWLRNSPGKLIFSFNGFKDGIDCRINIPGDIYDREVLVYNGLNKFDQLATKAKVIAKDALYIRDVRKGDNSA
jgi:DNA adenine methylase